MRRLPGRRPRGVERGRERALLLLRRGLCDWRRRWLGSGLAAGEDAFEESLRGDAGALSAAAGQLLDLAPEPRIVGTLCQECLIDAQRVLLVTLLQVELGHPL